jgi:hypothetical protein
MAKPLLTGGNGKANDFVGTATGQVPVWTESGDGEWVLGTGSGGGGGGRLFYLNDSTPPEAPTTNIPTGASGETVKELGTAADSASTTVLSTSSIPVLPDAPELVIGFVTDLNVPGITSIPAGLWEFNVWAEADGNTTNQSYLQAKVYKYDGVNAPGTAGSDLIASSGETYIFDPGDVTQYTMSVLIPGGTTLLATDRIYVEILCGATTSGRQVTLYFGNSEPSHVHTTILVPVNLATDVTGILPLANGGTGAGTGSLVNANEVFAGPASGADALPTFRALVAADVAGITPYDLRGKFVGNPATGLVLDTFVADRAFTIGATNTLHKFWADEKTAGADVVITVQRTRAGSTSTIFTATSASGDAALNGYYPMTISAVSNNDIAVDDLVEVVMGTTQAAFSTPVWTIYGTA